MVHAVARRRRLAESTLDAVPGGATSSESWPESPDDVALLEDEAPPHPAVDALEMPSSNGHRELAPAARLAAAERPDFEKVGLGYRATYAGVGVQLHLNRIRESHGEISGELAVRLNEPTDADESHLFSARFNVSSITSRNSWAKYLNDYVRADWPALLARFCTRVLQAERQGSDVVTVGRRPPRENVDRYALWPTLLAKKITIIGGPGGSYKSTLVAGMVVSSSTTHELIPGWQPRGRMKWLRLDYEEQDEVQGETFEAQVQMIARGAGIEPPDIEYREMYRPLADDLDRVAEIVSERGIKGVVIDPAGPAIGSSEGGWTDMAERFMVAVRQLRTTAIIIDHVAGVDVKAVEPVSKLFGSIVKTNRARNVFELRKETGGTKDRTEIVLTQLKTNSRPLPPQEFAVVWNEKAATIRFEREEVEAPDLQGRLPAVERIARVLRTGPKSMRAIADATSLSLNTVSQTVKRWTDKRFTRLSDERVALLNPGQENVT